MLWVTFSCFHFVWKSIVQFRWRWRKLSLISALHICSLSPQMVLFSSLSTRMVVSWAQPFPWTPQCCKVVLSSLMSSVRAAQSNSSWTRRLLSGTLPLQGLHRWQCFLLGRGHEPHWPQPPEPSVRWEVEAGFLYIQTILMCTTKRWHKFVDNFTSLLYSPSLDIKGDISCFLWFSVLWILLWCWISMLNMFKSQKPVGNVFCNAP